MPLFARVMSLGGVGILLWFGLLIILHGVEAEVFIMRIGCLVSICRQHAYSYGISLYKY